MNVNWEEAIQRWQSLNLSSLYHAEDVHNRSLALISSIISRKLHESVSTHTTSTVSSAILHATSAITTGDASHHTQAANANLQSSISAGFANPISWQTAFWTTAAIALNTCLQDCGRVCAIQKEFALLVRSSPLFCLVDSSIILLQLLFFAYTKGPKKAIQIVALSRDQHSFQFANEDPGPSQYITRGILLTLAVIQSIKLFALSGIPWTRFFGACYLSSYTVNALLNVFGKPQSEIGAVDIPQRGSMMLDRRVIMQAANLAAVAQVVAWTVSLAHAVPDDSLNSWGTCGIVLHLAGILYVIVPILAVYSTTISVLLFVDFAIVLGPAGIVLYFCHIHPRSEWPSIVELTSSTMSVTDDTAVIGIGIVLGLISFTLHLFFYPFSVFAIIHDPFVSSQGQKIFPIIDEWDPYGLVLVFISVSAFLSHLVARIFLFGALAKKLHLRHLSIASHMGSACLYLFVANVVFALIYFTMGYNPDDTYKPGWTDNFGKLLL